MITAVTRPFSRRALSKPNLVYFLWRFVANGIRTCRAVVAGSSDSDVRTIASELNTEGIVVAASERFLTQDGRQGLREAASKILETSRSAAVEARVTGTAVDDERQKKFMVNLVSYADGVPASDPVLRVALDTKLLEIVAAYLGLWPVLHSVDAWLNYPTDGPPEISQLWHRDPEDLKLVKVFIYLNDVDERCGPFTYIPKTHPFGAETVKSASLEKKKRIHDERMTRVFPPDSWRICVGGANTMILADTLGYHRGGKPIVGRRILLTFTYTSGTPITDRPIRVDGMPKWISSGIQKAAVRPLLTVPRRPVERKGEKRRAR
jgi:hypothetical protein